MKLENAKKHFDKKEYEQALSIYQDLARMDSQNYEAFAGIAVCLVHLLRFRESLEHFAYTYQKHKQNELYFSAYLTALVESNEIKKAKDIMFDAVMNKLHQKMSIKFKDYIGNPSLEKQQSIIQSMNKFDSPIDGKIAAMLFIDDYPKHLLGYQIMAYICDNEGSYDEAIFWWNKGLETNPNNAQTLANLAHTLINKKDYDQALIVVKKAISIDSSNATAKENLEKIQQIIGL